MKNFTLFLFFLISFNLSAQTNILGEWYLYSITIDGETQQNTFSNDFNIVFNSGTNGWSVNGAAVCNSYSTGSIPVMIQQNTIYEGTITIQLETISTSECATDAENQFEADFFSLFPNGNSAVFDYHVDGPWTVSYNVDDLTLTTQDGNYLTFIRQKLIDSNPLVGEWFLYELIYSAGYSFSDIPLGVSVVFTDDTTNGENSIVINGVCDTYTSTYLTPIYEDAFLCLAPSWSPSMCGVENEIVDDYLYDAFNAYNQYYYTSANYTGRFIGYEISGSGINELLEVKQVYPFADGVIVHRIGRFSRQQLSISDETISDKLKIHPNPTSEILHISNFNAEGAFYSILGLDGKIIIDQQPIIESKINLSFLENGIYFLRIRSDNSSEVLKFIKN